MSPGAHLQARIALVLALWRGTWPGEGPRSQILSPAETEKLGKALLRLQRGLTGDRGLAGTPYMDDRELLGAYFLYYWPVTYLQVSCIVAELRARGQFPPHSPPRHSSVDVSPGPKPEAAGCVEHSDSRRTGEVKAGLRILDLGCGPGAASAALLDAVQDAIVSRAAADIAALDTESVSVVLVDASDRALDLAAGILGDAGLQESRFASPRADGFISKRPRGAAKPGPEAHEVFSGHRAHGVQGPEPSMRLGAQNPRPVPDSRPPAVPRITRIAADLQGTLELPDGPFDIVVASHVLNELWKGLPDAPLRRLALLDSMAARMEPEGLLILVEPAVQAASRDLLALRDAFLAGHPDFSVAGPCPADCPCPALAAGDKRSCHAEYPWSPPEPIASLAASAGLDRASVKASWVAFGRRDVAPGRALSTHIQNGIDGIPETEAPSTHTRDSREPRVSEAHPSAGTQPQTDTRTPPGFDLSGRIVSEPMLNKAGRLRYLVCQGSALVTVSAARDDPSAQAAGYFDLCRGDEVAFAHLAPSPSGTAGGGTQGLRFVAESSLRVLHRHIAVGHKSPPVSSLPQERRLVQADRPEPSSRPGKARDRGTIRHPEDSRSPGMAAQPGVPGKPGKLRKPRAGKPGRNR